MLWCVLLFILGVSLIVVEFLLPGLVCGILGVIFLVVSTGIGINLYPEYTVFIIIGEVLGACAGIALGFYGLGNTRLGRSLFLDTSQDLDKGFVNIPSAAIAVGTTGRVLTNLRPSGTIIVGAERYDAVSDGNLIEAGQLVQVIEVHGNRVVVEALEEMPGQEIPAG